MNLNFMYVYDKNLHLYFRVNGQRYITTGLHPKNKRQFWQYLKDEKMDELYLEFLDKKSKNKT